MLHSEFVPPLPYSKFVVVGNNVDSIDFVADVLLKSWFMDIDEKNSFKM